MPLGEALAVVVNDERAVEPGGDGIAEGAIEEDLTGGGLEQVGAADDFCDAHGVVIDDAGELVAGQAVAAPDDEVAEVDAGGEGQRAEVEVVEGDDFAVGDAEAPVEVVGNAVGDGRQGTSGPTGSWIDGLVLGVRGCVARGAFMGRGDGGSEVLSRAAAGIEKAAEEQATPGVDVGLAALTLKIGLAGTADVRAFMPADAEPEQIFNRGAGEFTTGAVGVEIFDAENERALCVAGALIGLPEGAGVADVEIAGGRRRKTAAIAGGVRCWKDAGHVGFSVLGRKRRDEVTLVTMAGMRGRPDVTEFDAYFATYIGKVTGDDPLAAMERQMEEWLPVLEGTAPERTLERYAPGKWTMREVLNHIADTERVFAFRGLWFARGFESALPGFDQDVGVVGAKADAIAWPALIEEFKRVRAATLMLYQHLPSEAWMRVGVANQKKMTVRAVAFILAGHAEHHLRMLRERYLK